MVNQRARRDRWRFERFGRGIPDAVVEQPGRVGDDPGAPGAVGRGEAVVGEHGQPRRRSARPESQRQGQKTRPFELLCDPPSVHGSRTDVPRWAAFLLTLRLPRMETSSYSVRRINHSVADDRRVILPLLREYFETIPGIDA